MRFCLNLRNITKLYDTISYIYKPNLPKTSQSSGKIDKELLRKEFLEIT